MEINGISETNYCKRKGWPKSSLMWRTSLAKLILFKNLLLFVSYYIIWSVVAVLVVLGQIGAIFTHRGADGEMGDFKLEINILFNRWQQRQQLSFKDSTWGTLEILVQSERFITLYREDPGLELRIRFLFQSFGWWWW